jgi:hypothetical protein
MERNVQSSIFSSSMTLSNGSTCFCSVKYGRTTMSTLIFNPVKCFYQTQCQVAVDTCAGRNRMSLSRVTSEVALEGLEQANDLRSVSVRSPMLLAYLRPVHDHFIITISMRTLDTTARLVKNTVLEYEIKSKNCYRYHILRASQVGLSAPVVDEREVWPR